MTTQTTKTRTDLSQAEQACAEGESALERGDTSAAENLFTRALRLAGVGDGGATEGDGRGGDGWGHDAQGDAHAVDAVDAGGPERGIDVGSDAYGVDAGGPACGSPGTGGPPHGPDTYDLGTGGPTGVPAAESHAADRNAGTLVHGPDAETDTDGLNAAAPVPGRDVERDAYGLGARGSTGGSDTDRGMYGPGAGSPTRGPATGNPAHSPLPEGAARVVARAWTGVGRVWLARGEGAGAEAEFARAHALRPSAAGPLHWLGCAAAHRGDLAAAERHLTASLACAVPHGRSLVQRAYVHARAGNPDSALGDLRAAASAGPLDDEARWLFAVLAGGSTREVALRLRRAALAALGGHDGDELRRRAAALLVAARGLDPGSWSSSPLYAVALVRGGYRAAAVALLDDAVRDDPSDHRVTHTLAVGLLNSGDAGSGSTWERCVAAWAALLHDAGFWAHVLESASRRYGVGVEPSLVPVLRAGLREALERCLPDDAGTRVALGPLLQREADAAKLLAAIGGFPAAGGGGAPLFCGPLRIAELGRSAEFGAFAAAWEQSFAIARTASASASVDARAQSFAAVSATSAEVEAETETGPEAGAEAEAEAEAETATATATATPSAASTSLTYAFSELGFARLLLGQDKAVDALAALSELRCPSCRARGGPGAGAVCEPACGRFDELNPGYAGVPDKHLRLSLDARGLALEARLSMGRSEMTSARPDFGAAAAYWRRALVHSREIDRYRETQTAIVDMALGAARAAHRDGRLSLAVSTLDATRSVIGANERGRLEGQLARVLADRGISVANDAEALLDRPAADLRRSVAFNPHLLRAQVSLGIVLRGLAAARWSSGSLSGARDTLREAVDQLTAALALFPDEPDLEELREAAVADLDHVMWQPDESEQ
ncbi:tetratricopeptide repeat protein [Streptomyces venezuelae]|uniref:tetratricopeptide repeat protein n=1 Tax=Streptomyces venezuelae TaxID=54571 RepID=UPI001238BB0A|nr:hypothetical protein [Streptomyces venezuelae]